MNNTTNTKTGAYTCFGKTWAKTSLLRQNQIVTILRNQVIKQAIKEKERNSKIVAILNRYKDTLDDFIDNSNSEFLPRLINKSSRNMPRSKGGSTGFLKDNYLNKDFLALKRSSQLIAKTKDSQLHQCYKVALFNPKNKRAQYKKS